MALDFRWDNLPKQKAHHYLVKGENTMEKISGFSGDYRFLSNFFPCRIVYNGYIYSNLEAAFQSEKCADPRDCEQFGTLSASEAKRMGRSVELRQNWEQCKVSVMRDLLRVKFMENPNLQTQLLDTGDARLIEGNRWHDNFWGDCTCDRCAGKPGKNVLGQLLMELRDSLREWKMPEGTPKDFRYMGVTVNPLRLFSKDRVLSLLFHSGASCDTLDYIRDRYRRVFGKDLVWRYPILDTVEDGCVLIPVREGFLRLPYDSGDAEPTEYYRTGDAHLLDHEAIGTMLRELNAYTDGLRSALSEMLPPLGGCMHAKDEPFLTLDLPDGKTLRAAVSHDAEYPSIRIELEGQGTKMNPEPLCFVEHNPNRPDGHQICICAYTESSDDPDYYKSYLPCAEDKEGCNEN